MFGTKQINNTLHASYTYKDKLILHHALTLFTTDVVVDRHSTV